MIDIGHLKQCVDLWITGTSFTEDNLPHAPIVIHLVRDLLLCLDDHEVTRFDAQQCWWTCPNERADSWGEMINAHQYA